MDLPSLAPKWADSTIFHSGLDSGTPQMTETWSVRKFAGPVPNRALSGTSIRTGLPDRENPANLLVFDVVPQVSQIPPFAARDSTGQRIKRVNMLTGKNF
jgi:hypothetical protein